MSGLYIGRSIEIETLGLIERFVWGRRGRVRIPGIESDFIRF